MDTSLDFFLRTREAHILLGAKLQFYISLFLDLVASMPRIQQKITDAANAIFEKSTKT